MNQVQRSKEQRRIGGLMIAAGEGIFEKDIVTHKREVEVPTSKGSRPIKYPAHEKEK